MDRSSATSSANSGVPSQHWGLLPVLLIVCLIVSVASLWFLAGNWIDLVIQVVFVLLYIAALADFGKPYFVTAHFMVSSFLETLFYLTLVLSTPHKMWFLMAALITGFWARLHHRRGENPISYQCSFIRLSSSLRIAASCSSSHFASFK